MSFYIYETKDKLWTPDVIFMRGKAPLPGYSDEKIEEIVKIILEKRSGRRKSLILMGKKKDE